MLLQDALDCNRLLHASFDNWGRFLACMEPCYATENCMHQCLYKTHEMSQLCQEQCGLDQVSENTVETACNTGVCSAQLRPYMRFCLLTAIFVVI